MQNGVVLDDVVMGEDGGWQKRRSCWKAEGESPALSLDARRQLCVGIGVTFCWAAA